MKIHVVGAELFHVCRQADMTKLTVTVCNFANVPTRQHKEIKHHSKENFEMYSVKCWRLDVTESLATQENDCWYGSKMLRGAMFWLPYSPDLTPLISSFGAT
jgi:hypothetical protein